MKIVKCSIPVVTVGANCPSKHKNVDVNTDQVESITTENDIDFVGNTICFRMISGHRIEWCYRHDKHLRDKDYLWLTGGSK